MAADFKSHVLRRDEKGLFGIPFKRLLLAGCAGGLAYTLTNIIAPSWSIPFALIVIVSAITLTSLRGGIPLWGRIGYRLRGELTRSAVQRPTVITHHLNKLIDLSPDHIRLDSAVIFAPPHDRGEINLSEWIIYAHSDDSDGLIFVQSPLEENA